MLDRLKWKCRRGMLELDVVLTRYLASGFPESTPEEQQAFEKLLDADDPDLFVWLMGYAEPDPIHQTIVNKVRHAIIRT